MQFFNDALQKAIRTGNPDGMVPQNIEKNGFSPEGAKLVKN